MKIIQLMPEFRLAGAETMCENLTCELISRGHDVLVVSLYDYHSVITDRLEKKCVRIVYLGKKPGLDLSVIGKLRRVLKSFNPDIIHTHRYLLKYLFLANYGLNGKIVHTVHNMAKKENNLLDRTFNGVLFRKYGVTPVALSKIVKESILEEYHLSPEQVPVIFNGVPINNCKPHTNYHVNDTINILHIGRFMEAKNHLELVKAVIGLHEKNPQVVLHLLGEGPMKSVVGALINEKKAAKYILMHGVSPTPLQHLSEADIFVLPSLYEGMPMTIIEAMGTALPIVASAVGGVPDMIHDGVNGLLCEPTSSSIMQKLSVLIKDEQLRKRLGQKALESSQRFSSAHMAEAYEKLYILKIRKNHNADITI